MECPDIITVTGFGARYLRAFEKLLGIEGDFVEDPADSGGATKLGISLRFLKAAGDIDLDEDGFKDFDLDFDGDIDGVDVRLLSVADARYLYLIHFWNPLECASFPAPIGEMLFDQGVNGGIAAARKLLQRAINRVLAAECECLIAVDGKIGPATRTAMSLAVSLRGIEALAEAFREEVRARYCEIVRRNQSQRRFLNGWLRRAGELGA